MYLNIKITILYKLDLVNSSQDILWAWISFEEIK